MCYVATGGGRDVPPREKQRFDIRQPAVGLPEFSPQD